MMETRRGASNGSGGDEGSGERGGRIEGGDVGKAEAEAAIEVALQEWALWRRVWTQRGGGWSRNGSGDEGGWRCGDSVVKHVEMLKEATEGCEGRGEAERRQRRSCGAASGGCVWEAAMEARDWPAARSFGGTGQRAQSLGVQMCSLCHVKSVTKNASTDRGWWLHLARVLYS